MEWMIGLDRDLLRIINTDLSNRGFDYLFVNLTDFHKTMLFQTIVLPLMLIIFVWKYRAPGLKVIVGLAVTMAVTDSIGSQLIKKYFERLRPDLAGEDIILKAPHFGGFSFVSNHAANMFCLAVFMGFFYPKIRWPLLALAALVAFSRVYVGVHYPLDVLGGACFGSLMGWWGSRIWNRLIKRAHLGELKNG